MANHKKLWGGGYKNTVVLGRTQGSGECLRVIVDLRSGRDSKPCAGGWVRVGTATPTFLGISALLGVA